MDDLKTGHELEAEDGDQAEQDSMEDVPREEAGAEDHPAAGSGAKTLDADTILDTIVPDSIDWRNTVVRHPISSVLAVGLAGYILGRTRGSAIVAGLTTGISAAVTRQLSDVLEGEFFEFE